MVWRNGRSSRPFAAVVAELDVRRGKYSVGIPTASSPSSTQPTKHSVFHRRVFIKRKRSISHENWPVKRDVGCAHGWDVGQGTRDVGRAHVAGTWDKGRGTWGARMAGTWDAGRGTRREQPINKSNILSEQGQHYYPLGEKSETLKVTGNWSVGETFRRRCRGGIGCGMWRIAAYSNRVAFK